MSVRQEVVSVDSTVCRKSTGIYLKCGALFLEQHTGIRRRGLYWTDSRSGLPSPIYYTTYWKKSPWENYLVAVQKWPSRSLVNSLTGPISASCSKN